MTHVIALEAGQSSQGTFMVSVSGGVRIMVEWMSLQVGLLVTMIFIVYILWWFWGVVMFYLVSVGVNAGSSPFMSKVNFEVCGGGGGVELNLGINSTATWRQRFLCKLMIFHLVVHTTIYLAHGGDCEVLLFSQGTKDSWLHVAVPWMPWLKKIYHGIQKAVHQFRFKNVEQHLLLGSGGEPKSKTQL